jgi:protein-L-isoaspartate O-methyltransferase
MRVLEVGAGTGYNAALLAAITTAPVVTIDSNQHVVAEAQAALPSGPAPPDHRGGWRRLPRMAGRGAL